jgi:hypothetical protein
MCGDPRSFLFLSKAIVPNATHPNYFRVIASLHCDNVGIRGICGQVLRKRLSANYPEF